MNKEELEMFLLDLYNTKEPTLTEKGKQKIIKTIEDLQDRVDFLIDRNDKKQEVLDKIKEIVDKSPCLWCVDEEFERVDGTIELSYEEYIGWKDILELLEEIE